MDDLQIAEKLGSLDSRTEMILTLLQDHVKNPCGQCELKDNVAVLESQMVTHRRVGYGIAGFFLVAIKFLYWKTFGGS